MFTNLEMLLVSKKNRDAVEKHNKLIENCDVIIWKLKKETGNIVNNVTSTRGTYIIR